MTIIYGLVDPRDQQLRYVGKTWKPLAERLKQHIRVTRKEANHRAYWIRALRTLGLTPEAFVIEEVDGDGCESEMHHIAYFKSIGCNLVNGTVGGEGVLGHRHTAEAKARMSALQMGNKSSVGRVLSDETRERIAAANRGKKHSEEFKERRRAFRHSEATKEKMSGSQKDRGARSEETRERMRLAWVKRRAK